VGGAGGFDGALGSIKCRAGVDPAAKARGEFHLPALGSSFGRCGCSRGRREVRAGGSELVGGATAISCSPTWDALRVSSAGRW